MPRTPARSRQPAGSGRPAASRSTAGRSNVGRSRPPRQRTPQPHPSGGRPSALQAALDQAAARPPLEPQPFSGFGLPEPLVAALHRRGIRETFAIQSGVLPDALAGRNVLGRARTGSGKTLAFGVPLLARLADAGRPAGATAPRALILVPTRELAKQVADELAPLAKALRLSVATVYGGAAMGRQIDQLRRGADVVVATPGRLIDLMERRACRLDQAAITVLDEADHMADLGFLPAVRQILDATPVTAQRLLLSATLDAGVERLVTEYVTDPTVHATVSPVAVVAAMEHRVLTMPATERVVIAAEIAARPGRTLIFVRTKHGADRLARQLTQAGAPAGALHGNQNQNQRQRALDAFTAGQPRVLVATDVAARGIHVDDVDLVIHFDLPNDHKDYLHRSGRTARAGAQGTVVAFAPPGQSREIAALHRQASVTPTAPAVVHPGHPAVRELAESGTPIPVPPPRPAAAAPVGTARRRPGRNRPSRPRPRAASAGRS